MVSGKPNFFIAGAAKSGTSSLFHYLGLHPKVYMSPIKEPHFFCDEYFPDHFSGPGDEGFSKNRLRDINEYLKLFAASDQAKVVGEGSVYYLYFPGVAEKLYQFNSQAKVVLILRNPVDRAFSAYMHTVRDGRETLTFEEALQQEESRRHQGYQPLWWYRELGLYSCQVQRYIRVFPKDQLKIYLFEDLQDTSKVINDVLSFLGLENDEHIDTSVRYNESGVPKSRFLYNFFAKPNVLKEIAKPLLPQKFRQRLGQRAKTMVLQKESMDPNTRLELQRYYRQDIEKLQTLINRDLSAWLK
ncbi:sulfotransferase family protein [Alicyclobacillus dauci]|uniref:Sulfotransferase n=1 Tax=Alicyclobacillus dauci TaxID=1475485 RepID=A0ABY6Z207_9BACL|nr:sulfotransferase [Alicyclobacillus dauci]WAH36938.1 sulfotransferase [Alicyclobacillus dauci]